MDNKESFVEAFRARTKMASLRVIRLYQQLPRTGEAEVVGKLLLRAAPLAANYRAACRGRSGAEWYAKMCIWVEKADETLFWLELLSDAAIAIISKVKSAGLIREYLKIVSVLATARKSCKNE